MFIIIHKTNPVAGIKYKRILILKRIWSATSHVTATFHPTIGQCDHQSLSNTATPEMGIRDKGKLASSHIAKDTQFSQANTVGFIR